MIAVGRAFFWNDSMSQETRWRIRFFGRVQKVGFRYTALRIAGKLGLTGWVRNLSDGSVQTEVQGKPSEMRKFLILLKGQPHLHIVKYTIEEIPAQQGERKFRVSG